MKQICPPRHCTGCGACANACPKQCISLDYDNNGFLHPNINKSQCIGCDKCRRVCPSINPIEKNAPERAIVASSLNRELVRQSSSGGLFGELALYVLNSGGLVCGAAFTNDFLSVQHCIVIEPADLVKIQGSKYIQSNIGSIYAKTKDHLRDGRLVLFCGTPCQVAGLKSYLGKEFPNLITVDFVCHGVASTKAYQEYIKSFNIQAPISDVTFRYKKTSDSLYKNSLFRLSYANGSVIEENWLSSSLCYAFAINLLSRLSCSSCNYCTLARVSDITLADYISDIEEAELRASNSSKSLILINTKKGAELFGKIQNNLLLADISLEKAVSVSKHLSAPAEQHRNRSAIFKHLGRCSWEKLSSKYFTTYKPHRTFKSIRNKFLQLMRVS